MIRPIAVHIRSFLVCVALPLAGTQAVAQTPPAPVASVAPVAPAPAPSPTASPTTQPTATPVPAPTPLAFTYVVEPPLDPAAPPNAPRIYRVELSDRVLHQGGPFVIRITTTPNVARMIASAAGRDLEIQKAADGVFSGGTTLPTGIPFFLFHAYDVSFTATAFDGSKTTITIPVTLAR